MNISEFPTKGNLINARNSLKFSQQGYDLLDKKRTILISEMIAMIDRAEKLQDLADLSADLEKITLVNSTQSV